MSVLLCLFEQYLHCCVDIEGHERQLEALRNSLDPLLVSAKEQSQEIDELLNIYEQTVSAYVLTLWCTRLTGYAHKF